MFFSPAQKHNFQYVRQEQAAKTICHPDPDLSKEWNRSHIATLLDAGKDIQE
jgi:hypothetical protein